MKLLHGLFVLALIASLASTAEANATETTKGKRLTSDTAALFPSPKWVRTKDQCDMAKPTPVTRIYETYSKSRTTVARQSVDTKCHTMLQKKRVNGQVDIVLACKASGVPVECEMK